MLFIKSLNKTDWQIQIEKPISKIDIIIRYIGRYSKIACVSEHKITNIEGEYITFKYKDYTDRDSDNKHKVNFLFTNFVHLFTPLK